MKLSFLVDFLVSNFFFSLNFWHIKKKFVISFSYCPKYIISIKKKRKEKKRLFKKTLMCFCRIKLNKGKLDQLNLELAQI